jgi:hypothetical protein
MVSFIVMSSHPYKKANITWDKLHSSHPVWIDIEMESSRHWLFIQHNPSDAPMEAQTLSKDYTILTHFLFLTTL